MEGENRKYQIGTKENKECLEEIRKNLLEFGRQFPAPDGSSYYKATNGESFEDQYRRVADFLDELRQKPYEQVAIFAHGGILLNAQIYAGIIKPEEAFGALTPYGGIVKIELS